MRLRALVSVAALAAALAAVPVSAQHSAIVADEGAQRGTGTLVEQGEGATVIDGGTLQGGNLFHSFSQFDLSTGENAQWVFSFGDPDSIENIVNRVTGGGASTIDGTIDATLIPNAKFFFINPAGIVFGENAVINVPAAAHFSTASHIDFADGARFSAITPKGSTFSMVAPASFGFLGDEGALAVFGNAARPELSNAGELLLSASRIGISGRTLTANVIGITATGTGNSNVPALLADAQAAFGDGQISISDSVLSTDAIGGIGLAAGAIAIAGQSIISSETTANEGASLRFLGGQFALSEGSIIETVTMGEGDGGFIGIEVVESMLIDNAAIRTATLAEGKAGNIVLAGPSVDISSAELTTRSGAVQSDPAADGVDASGASGNIQISADRLAISDFSLLSNNSLGSGTLGSIGLFAPSITIEASAVLQTSVGAFDLSGIVISAEDLALVGGTIIGTEGLENANAGSITLLADTAIVEASTIVSNTSGAGDSGPIQITADTLALMPGAQIASTTFGSGSGSLINIAASSFVADTAVLRQQSLDQGASGSININATRIEATNSTFDTDAQGSGAGGLIFIAADESIRLETSTLTSSALGVGNAGFIRLRAPQVEGTGLIVTAGTLGPGAGGGLTVEAQQVRLQDSALFFPTFGDGAAGALLMRAEDVAIANTLFVSDSSGAGGMGLISIVSDTIRISDDTLFSLSSNGMGGDAVLELIARELEIENGGFLSFASAEGNAGSVFIEAERARIFDTEVELSSLGSGNAGLFILDIMDLSLANSRIRSTTEGSGSGGIVRLLNANSIDLANVSIATDAQGSGDAGAIEIFGQQIAITETELTSVSDGSGNAGFINMMGGTLEIVDTTISTEAVLSGSGQIAFAAERISISNSLIDATNSGDGISAQIGLDASEAIELRATEISSNSFGLSAGGDIAIFAPDILLNGAAINANAVDVGDGGRILLVAEDGSLAIRGGSTVSSSVGAEADAGIVLLNADDVLLEESTLGTITIGNGNGGTIRINAQSLSFEEARVLSSTFPFDPQLGPFTGNAGSIDIDAGTIEAFSSELASNTQTQGNGGSVTISADALALTASEVSTAAFSQASGSAGDISITVTGGMLLNDRSSIASTNDGSDTAIDSAGTIAISANSLALADASEITTNSAAGPAGNIAIELPDQGTLLLRGGAAGQSIITTSSGPGTGGVITISDPLAIISQGGEIRALGQQGGANVLLRSAFFIDAADTLDAVLVDGTLTFDGNLDYFAAGEEAVEINPLDAGAVLSGRCRSERASGSASQFSAAPTGPFPAAIDRATDESAASPEETKQADPCR